MKINGIKARLIYNSRGDETVEVDVFAGTRFGRGSAPAGASTGANEAVAYPNGVKESISFINKTLAPDLLGFEFNSFDDLGKVEEIFRKYDDTLRWEKIGGNTVIAVEFALLHALAVDSKTPLWKVINPDADKLPRPLGNAVGGGAHAGKNACDIQEFLLLCMDAKTFRIADGANIKIHKLMKKELSDADPNFTGGKTDEGAWAPNISNMQVLDILSKVVKKVNNEDNINVRIGLDMAASQFWDGEHFVYHKFMDSEMEKKLSRDEQIDFVVDLVEKYDLCYVEDPLNEDDFEGYAQIKQRVDDCLICGDDLICTSPELLQQAIDACSVSAVIVKPNQVGSLVKTKEIIKMALDNNIVPVISHRSGETNTKTIAHIGIAFGCPVIKTGVVGGERRVKLNALLRAEELMKE